MYIERDLEQWFSLVNFFFLTRTVRETASTAFSLSTCVLSHELKRRLDRLHSLSQKRFLSRTVRETESTSFSLTNFLFSHELSSLHKVEERLDRLLSLSQKRFLSRTVRETDSTSFFLMSSVLSHELSSLTNFPLSTKWKRDWIDFIRSYELGSFSRTGRKSEPIAFSLTNSMK